MGFAKSSLILIYGKGLADGWEIQIRNYLIPVRMFDLNVLPFELRNVPVGFQWLFNGLLEGWGHLPCLCWQVVWLYLTMMQGEPLRQALRSLSTDLQAEQRIRCTKCHSAFTAWVFIMRWSCGIRQEGAESWLSPTAKEKVRSFCSGWIQDRFYLHSF